MSQSSPAVLGPVESSVRPAIIREYGHPDVVRGDAVAVAPGQRIELVLWADMEAEVRRAVAAERQRWQDAVLYELDDNGQARAIIAKAKE